MMRRGAGFDTDQAAASGRYEHVAPLELTADDDIALASMLGTAAQTFTNGDFLLKGSSSGAMTLEAPAAASTYVMTFPAATHTVAVLGTNQTFRRPRHSLAR